MQPLIERAMVNEDTDVQALRELAVAQTVDEPSPRVMCDGGRPAPRPAAGWRSPLGGPRYTAEQPGDDYVEEWPESRIQDELEEIEFGRATVEPDEEVRTDGGNVQLREGEHRDDDNVHRLRNDAQHEIADEYLDDDLEEIHVGDHVRDRDEEDGATMLVVGTPLEQADEYECNGQTIADYNEDYPADDDVLEVVFPSRTDVSTRPLDRYAYPRSRLRLEASIHGDGGDADGE